MPTINDVNLTVQKKAHGPSLHIGVEYTIRFSDFELKACSAFIESVILCKTHPIRDDLLITFRTSCIKAEKRCVNRYISENVMQCKREEEGNLIDNSIPHHNEEDDIYSLVKLAQFNPDNIQGYSNIVKKQLDIAKQRIVNHFESQLRNKI